VNVVDSSAWLAYFADAPNAGFFAAAIEATDQLLVPTVVVYEVHKRVRQQRDEAAALQATGIMLQGRVIDLTTEIALLAARVGLELGLPMADALILATARAHSATLWTQDADFRGLEGVRFRAKGG
jgi:toxin FitB